MNKVFLLLFKLKLIVLFISIQLSVFSQNDSIEIVAHVPYGWINDFQFYKNGIFISDDINYGIKYYTINSNYNLLLKYTIVPPAVGIYDFNQFVVHDSLLFITDGSYAHLNGTNTFFIYSITDSSYTLLSGLEIATEVSPFYSMIYHEQHIIYYRYSPGSYYKIDVTDPTLPFIEDILFAQDVNKTITLFQDSLLIASCQRGTAYYDRNFRIIKNNDPDSLISLSTFESSNYSYTCGTAIIGNILFGAHHTGLRAYDLSNLNNIQPLYFYPTAWGRYLEHDSDIVYMSCNDGWHVFRVVNQSTINHIQYLPNDTRTLRFRYRYLPNSEDKELWCFVDGGINYGLVVFDNVSVTGVNNISSEVENIEISCFPNPFIENVNINFTLNKTEHIKVNIYNSKNQLVKTVADNNFGKGRHNIKCITNDLNKGVYFLRFITDKQTITKRLVKI